MLGPPVDCVPSGEKEVAIRQHAWNDYFLEVRGNHFVSYLNGVQMVDFTDPKNEDETGSIALQLHAGGGADIRFKDIMIRDLTTP